MTWACARADCTAPQPSAHDPTLCVFHEHSEALQRTRGLRAALRRVVLQALHQRVMELAGRLEGPLAHVPRTRGEADFLYRALADYLDLCDRTHLDSLSLDAQDVLAEDMSGLADRWHLAV